MTRSEFRKDIVSGDWILVAGGLKKKPNFFAKTFKRPRISKKGCPFENVAKGHKLILSSEFAKVVLNKFPILTPHKVCPIPLSEAPYKKMAGVGFQELVITPNHSRSLGDMTKEEVLSVLEAYLSRYQALKKEKCIEYILIFHNHGPSAGATVPHPHSQILALPIIPLDVSRSLSGSASYFKKYSRCVHCAILEKELRDKKRIIYKNRDFIAIAPYASHVSFETRLYPLKHGSNFEDMSQAEKENFADMMRVVLAKLKNGMNDTDYNFFIHTAPVKADHVKHYHWHLEILPRTSIWGGVELGTGTEVIKMPPEQAARILREAKT